MRRITIRDLEKLCQRINRLTEAAEEGHYLIDLHQGVGGTVCLEIENGPGGGVSDVLTRGHVSKRELYQRMDGFIKGLELSR